MSIGRLSSDYLGMLGGGNKIELKHHASRVDFFDNWIPRSPPCACAQKEEKTAGLRKARAVPQCLN